MSGKLQQVHVRVNDAATGKPTPCRVRFTDAQGSYYPPHGRLAKFAAGPNQEVGGDVYIGLKPHAYIDGTCEIHLPPGTLHVEISKGPEYRPLREDVRLVAGKLSLRFMLERWINLREQGWYSGDTRALFLSPHAALLEGQAEDLAVVNLLANQTSLKDAFGEAVNAFPNLLAFSGQAFALSVPGHGVAVNTLNRHPELGTLALLNCHRVVYPLAFGGPAGREDWTLADWCDQCHRKAGLVVWSHTAEPHGECGFGEALADLILGKIDAYEIDHFDGSPFDAFPDWMGLLNVGLQATLVGASGKDSNGRALGVVRTYARLATGQPFSYQSWIDAVRAGRTFVTNGPIVSLSVNGADPTTVPLRSNAGANLHIQAHLKSWIAVHQFSVYDGGEPIASATPSGGPPYEASLDFDHRCSGNSWLIALATGDAVIADRPASQKVFACTSPVYINTGSPALRAHTDALRRLLRELDVGLRWVHERARCDSEKDRQQLANVFRDAKRVLESRISLAAGGESGNLSG